MRTKDEMGIDRSGECYNADEREPGRPKAVYRKEQPRTLDARRAVVCDQGQDPKPTDRTDPIACRQNIYPNIHPMRQPELAKYTVRAGSEMLSNTLLKSNLIFQFARLHPLWIVTQMQSAKGEFFARLPMGNYHFPFVAMRTMMPTVSR